MATKKASSKKATPTKGKSSRQGKTTFQSEGAKAASLKAAQVVSRRIGGMQRGVQQRAQKRKDSR